MIMIPKYHLAILYWLVALVVAIVIPILVGCSISVSSTNPHNADDSISGVLKDMQAIPYQNGSYHMVVLEFEDGSMIRLYIRQSDNLSVVKGKAYNISYDRWQRISSIILEE